MRVAKRILVNAYFIFVMPSGKSGIFHSGKEGELSLSLSFSNTTRRGKRAINCGDVGISSNCPNWPNRHFFLRVLTGTSYDSWTLGFQGFFGWNPTRKCGSVPVCGEVDALFRATIYYYNAGDP